MTITIPKSALSDEGEQNEQVAPSVGDQVDLSNVVGMVQAEQGDNLVIEIKSVNGAPCNYDAEGGEQAPVDEASLRNAMESADSKLDNLQ